MASTLVKLSIHLVFHIKTSSPPIRASNLVQLFSYIAGTIKSLGGCAISVGGIDDHVHVLFSLTKTMSLSEAVRSIKASSSSWLKSIDPSYALFAWQDGYGAFSVSPSVIPRIISYIQHQREHHSRISYIQEYKSMLDACGVAYDERYAFAD